MRTIVAHHAAGTNERSGFDSRPTGRVLVALTDSCSSVAALGVGVLLARQRGSVLRIIAVAPRMPMGIWCAPVAVPWTAEQLQGDALEAARELSARALSLVDGHVCAHTSAASGRPQHLLAPLIQTGLFTAIVVPGEWAARPSFRRAARRWRRSGVELHAVWS